MMLSGITWYHVMSLRSHDIMWCHLGSHDSTLQMFYSQLALAPADYNLTEFKLDLFRIVCSHEHYIALNLPLLPSLDPPSPTSSTYDNGVPNIESMAILTPEFRQHHFLSGLVLSELARVLAGRYALLTWDCVRSCELITQDSQVEGAGSRAGAGSDGITWCGSTIPVPTIAGAHSNAVHAAVVNSDGQPCQPVSRRWWVGWLVNLFLWEVSNI